MRRGYEEEAVRDDVKDIGNRAMVNVLVKPSDLLFKVEGLEGIESDICNVVDREWFQSSGGGTASEGLGSGRSHDACVEQVRNVSDRF